MFSIILLRPWKLTCTDLCSYVKYIFPGLGLGTILSHASQVTDSMVDAAAISLADSVSDDEAVDGLIYPRLHRIRDISVEIALGTIRAAQVAVRIISRISFGERVDPNCVLGAIGCRQRTEVDNDGRQPTERIYQVQAMDACGLPLQVVKDSSVFLFTPPLDWWLFLSLSLSFCITYRSCKILYGWKKKSIKLHWHSLCVAFEFIAHMYRQYTV
jgi:hypothetical protein